MNMDEVIARINVLAKKAKTETLTSEEIAKHRVDAEHYIHLAKETLK